MFEDKFKKIKDALAIRTRTDPGPGPGPYTGPVSGETFNPLPGGIAGAQSGQRFGDSRGGRDHAGIDITEHKLKDSKVLLFHIKQVKLLRLKGMISILVEVLK